MHAGWPQDEKLGPGFVPNLDAALGTESDWR